MVIRNLFAAFIFVFSFYSYAYADEFETNNTYSNYLAATTCSVYDPYETINRKVFLFNGLIDTFTLRPITKIYIAITNDYTKSRVSSFASNLHTPVTSINYLIQGKPLSFGDSFWRFVINSTLGMAGFFDVASKFGISAPHQGFGDTLAYYGVGPGPYIVLPILGPTTARHFSDKLFGFFFDPLGHVLHKDATNSFMVVDIINSNTKVMPFIDYVRNNSADPYVAIRDAVVKTKETNLSYPSSFTCPK